LRDFLVSLDKNGGFLSQKVRSQYKRKFDPVLVAHVFELEGLFD
jgi:hypothetical protein